MEGSSAEVRDEDWSVNTSEGVDELGRENRNLAALRLIFIGTVISRGSGIDERSSPCVCRGKALNLGLRKEVYSEIAEGDGFGLDKLLALPKMSFAADATLHPVPPPVTMLVLPTRSSELGMTSGPPSSAPRPVLVDTSDVILKIVKSEST